MMWCILLVLVWLVGCTPEESAPPPPTSIKQLDQGRLTAVKVQLQQDPELAACNLQVTAENNLVTLRGTVPSEAARARAEAICKRVEGVDRVANHLTVDGAP